MRKLILFFALAFAASGQVLLEDFRAPRMNADTPPGPLWMLAPYPANQPSSYTIANNTLTLTTGANAAIDLEFFPKGPGWKFQTPCNTPACSYAQSYLYSGLWNENINRLKFQVRCNKAVSSPNVGGHNLEIGTYIRAHDIAATDNQGLHYYHQYQQNVYPGQWMQYVLTRTPQHCNVCSPSQQFPEDPEFNDPRVAGHPVHYFDGLTTFYFNDVTTAKVLQNSVCEFKNYVFDTVANEPDNHVSSMEGSYTGSAYEVNFSTPKNVPKGEKYLVRFSTSGSLKTLGFSKGADGGIVTGLDNVGYANARWTSPAVAQGQNAWVGLRPMMPLTGATNASPIVLSTMPSVYHSLADGDTVSIAGVLGNPAANGNWYVKVQSPVTVALYADTQLKVPVSGSGAYISGGTMTATSDFKNFTEIMIPKDAGGVVPVPTPTPVPVPTPTPTPTPVPAGIELKIVCPQNTSGTVCAVKVP